MEFISRTTETIAGKRKPEPGNGDERAMLRALELAAKGRLTASPNPIVGAVIVSGGEVVGEGFHMRAGEPHAEVYAVREAGERARGGTMYVTLEPCSHQGRTPPCAGLLIDAGLAKVVIAMMDPNPLVAGRGAHALAEAGVEVKRGPYEALAARQNETYAGWIVTGRPFLTLKMAMSIDGKVATRSGDSRWVTSESSRMDVHRMRAASDAVMVGIGTVLKDDPLLTARGVEAPRQPLRIIVDSFAGTPLDGRVADTGEVPTVVAVSSQAPREKVKALQAAGVEVVESGDRRVDLAKLLGTLGGRGVTSVLSEGGPTIAAALNEGGLVDRHVYYIAPKVVGGVLAPGPVGGEGIELMAGAAPLDIDAVFDMEPDIKVVAYPSRRAAECSQE
ncbi:MAG: bifunctional diaminohydroxyphosphoribosylaminopyrimidine deaminase/5-amino-6-(5-phosphoribosylamino)uracil reductase RibD [Candidatus Geothermincolia bacterium]